MRGIQKMLNRMRNFLISEDILELKINKLTMLKETNKKNEL
jgi:hypothetical protein